MGGWEQQLKESWKWKKGKGEKQIKEAKRTKTNRREQKESSPQRQLGGLQEDDMKS